MNIAFSARSLALCTMSASLLAASLLPVAHAATPPAQTATESREKITIREVLKDPVFGGEKQESEWRYTGTSPDLNMPPPTQPTWLASLAGIVDFLARSLRVLMWIGAALLLAALVYLLYRYRHAWMGMSKKRAPPPNFLFGLDVRPASLPDDVVAAALDALKRGNAADALSLLYRAALVSLIHHNQLEFRAGHTEDECLNLVRAGVNTDNSTYFSELLIAWKRTAYAHAAPPTPALEELCRSWGEHFARVDKPR